MQEIEICAPGSIIPLDKDVINGQTPKTNKQTSLPKRKQINAVTINADQRSKRWLKKGPHSRDLAIERTAHFQIDKLI